MHEGNLLGIMIGYKVVMLTLHTGGVTIEILWVLVRIWDQLTKISLVDTLQS